VIVAVPALLPVTTPVPELTVAMAVALLLQLPPDVALERVVDNPMQVVATPVFAVNVALTVTT
jgi:hypothetical protein